MTVLHTRFSHSVTCDSSYIYLYPKAIVFLTLFIRIYLLTLQLSEFPYISQETVSSFIYTRLTHHQIVFVSFNALAPTTL